MSARDEQFIAPDGAVLATEAAALDAAYQSAEGAVLAEQRPEGNTGGAWEVLTRRREELLAIEGVVMVGIGGDEIGDPAIVVGVKRPDQVRKLPASVDGLPVRAQLIGEVDAYTSSKKRRT